MDDSIIAVFVLFLVLVLFAAFVLPIVALVMTVRSKRTLTERISKLQSAPLDAQDVQQLRTNDLGPFVKIVQHLSARVDRLEEALRTGSIPIDRVEPSEKPPAVLSFGLISEPEED